MTDNSFELSSPVSISRKDSDRVALLSSPKSENGERNVDETQRKPPFKVCLCCHCCRNRCCCQSQLRQIITVTLITIFSIIFIGAVLRLAVWLQACIFPDKRPFSQVQASISAQHSRTVGSNLKAVFIGDVELGGDGSKLYNMIAQEKPDVLFIQGDLDYHLCPDCWMRQIEEYFPSDFPIFVSTGNHDRCVWPTYQDKIAARMSSQSVDNRICTGWLGVAQFCSYKGLLFTVSAPGLFVDDPRMNNLPTPAEFTDQAFTSLNATWKICLFHANMEDYQTGGPTIFPTDWPIYDACLKHGALIVTGHEHAYARTFSMSNLQEHVIASKNASHSILKPGQSVIILNGLGGRSVRGRDDAYRHPDWWANTWNADTGAHAAAVFCTFAHQGDQRRTECFSKDISGTIFDRFTLLSELPN